MSHTILYYVSGHGYGHARRANEVIRAFLRRDPGVRVHLRTLSPATIFDAIGPQVSHEAVPIDQGCIEIDPLNLDWPATFTSVEALIARQFELVDQEALFANRVNADMLLADIPFLPGYISHATGIPCWAIGNFTWDWIYEPYAGGTKIVEAVRAGYERMTGLFRLPFPQPSHPLPQTIDVPLIARVPAFDRAQVRRRMQIDPADGRPVVLMGMRGGCASATIARAAADTPEVMFVTPPADDLQPGENLRLLGPDKTLNFTDLLSACDVVISKLGHGILTDCIAAGTALLWPDRTGFREDRMIIEASVDYVDQLEIPRDDFQTGRWRDWILKLLADRRDVQTLPTNGADVIAGHVLGWINR